MPIYRASGALLPAIYLNGRPDDAPSTNATVAGAAAVAAQLRSEGLDVPVLPFSWECLHSGASLLNRSQLELELLAPYNMGADGLVIWGMSLNVCQGAGRDLDAYAKFVANTTGPMLQGFKGAADKCSQTQCSGRGRCTSVPLPGRKAPRAAAAPAQCRCLRGFGGASCNIKV